MKGKKMGPNPNLLYCSFCGKSQNEVGLLIAGPRVYICNECVVWCGKILEDWESEKISMTCPDKLPDCDGYVKGVGWRKIRGIEVRTTKRFDKFTGYYNRKPKIFEEGYQPVRVQYIISAKCLDESWIVVDKDD